MTGFDSFEQTIAARTIWGEARGEGIDGMKAVAHVLLNRQKDGRWGPTLGSVCLWPYQFSCWNPNDPQRKQMAAFGVMDLALGPPMAAFVAACEDATDLTFGATHYFADTIAPPSWSIGLTPTIKILHHAFYKGVR